MSAPRTLFEKVWDAHVIEGNEAGPAAAEPGPALLYVDLHLVHEVTSPQAFDGLRLAGRPVRRPDLASRARSGDRRAAGRGRPCGPRP